MRGLYLTTLLWLSLVSINSFAQDLINSRRSSYYTFIYRISNDQAGTLYKKIWKLDSTYMQELYDMYPTDSAYKKPLPVGHYLHVKVVDSRLNCELESVNNTQMDILNNHRDLIMLFHDSSGVELTNLKVHVRSKRVPFREELRAYRLSKTNKRGIVSAEYRGHVSYFEIDRRLNNTFFVRTGRKIIGSFPMNHVISPYYFFKGNIQSIVWGSRLRAPGFYYRIKRLFQYKSKTGYLVFNKPKFKPGDTLRLKAYVTTRKGRPINKDVTIYLERYWPDPIHKKIATIKPYNKGGYQYEILLVDSLKLRLDDGYTVALEDSRDRTYVSAGFRFENYELKNNSYFARSESKSKLEPATLYLKGQDSNEMPLFDARVEVTLKTKSIQRYYGDKVFVPDTIWTYRTKLDPIGETSIAIPDSIMPSASLDYQAIIAFINTENERIIKTLELKYNKRPVPVEIGLSGDSITVKNIDPKNPVLESVVLNQVDRLGNVQSKSILTPHAEKVNLFADYYYINMLIDSVTESTFFRSESASDNLNILASRTADSLYVQTNNPRKIPFRYFLFKNRRLIESAEAEDISFTRKVKTSDTYSLSVQYVWGGKPQSRDYTIPFNKLNLDINVDHPSIVYPGQTAEFKILVMDAKGQPVEHADLTAYAVTKKFESQSAPSPPSFAKQSKERSVFNEFNKIKVASTTSRTITDSNWSEKFGLDSIAFYDFLFPANGFYEFRADVDRSQFAPYVLRNGSTVPVQVIYVDGQPIYFKDVDTVEPYSFAISPGKHRIDLRLPLYLITIKNVKIEEKQKLIFSIDLNNLPANATLEKRSYKFTDAELRKLRRYFVLLKPKDGSKGAYLQQGNSYHLFDYTNTYYNYNNSGKLVGPFYPGTVSLVDKDGSRISLDYTPFYSYEFKNGHVVMKELNTERNLKNRISWSYQPIRFADEIQTIASIQNFWSKTKEPVSYSFQRFPYIDFDERRAGKLILAKFPVAAEDFRPIATFVVNVNNPDDYTLISGNASGQSFLPGQYEIVLIFDNDEYLRVDSVGIKPNGMNYYALIGRKLHEADSFSLQILDLLKDWTTNKNYDTQSRRQQLQDARARYYQESSSNYFFGHTVTGRIVSSEDGSPLPGVNVIVKGTTVGTVTDVDGYYSINTPLDGTLVFSFIGLVTEESPIRNRSVMDVDMQLDVTELSEVVVTGYAMQASRKMLSSSVSTILSGKVAGVVVRSPRYRHGITDSLSIAIRGMSTTSTEEPLAILDGKIVRYQDVDKNLLTAITVLKSAEAVSIYGSRAAGGVILMSTKPGATVQYLAESSQSVFSVAALEQTPGNALRKNFRDYAFWKPVLRTDMDGRASFSATFPDDITGWNAYVLGIAKRKTGVTQSNVQSYKPLLGQIAQPHFLIRGDTANSIGKITNYGRDELRLRRTLKIADRLIWDDSISVKDSKIDSILLVGQGSDSLSVEYMVKFNDYADGELRWLPIYEQGVEEVFGEFGSLVGDTTLTLRFNSRDGQIKIYAQADLMDVILDEIKFLRTYHYECNEQMASKLQALIFEKQIKEYRNEKFGDQRHINRLIRKLVANQNSDGSWGWWDNNEGAPWVTIHVARILTEARRQGFSVSFDQEMTINYLESIFMELTSDSKLDVLEYLLERGEKIQVKDFTDTLSNSKYASLHSKLMAQRLLQLSGETPNWEWIDTIKTTTVKGNIRWGETSYSLHNSAITNTLLVYKMIEEHNNNDKQLLLIRNYFFEIRKSTWRNTYESVKILETLLPSLIKRNRVEYAPALTLSGMINESVHAFPYEAIATGDSLTISKTGNSPVYFTAYQAKWNHEPVKSDKDFVVSTLFEDDVKTLEAGKPVKFIIKVEVKRDAEYVMVEVPIPAGCSYANRYRSRSNGEVHREYYNYKTNIYCKSLRKGVYTYTIDLLPRYSGSYSLNPAVVQCMYFPVIYGREQFKRVKIK